MRREVVDAVIEAGTDIANVVRDMIAGGCCNGKDREAECEALVERFTSAAAALDDAADSDESDSYRHCEYC